MIAHYPSLSGLSCHVWGWPQTYLSRFGESAVPMDVDAAQPNSAAAPMANGAAPRSPVKPEQSHAAEVCSRALGYN